MGRFLGRMRERHSCIVLQRMVAPPDRKMANWPDLLKEID